MDAASIPARNLDVTIVSKDCKICLLTIREDEDDGLSRLASDQGRSLQLCAQIERCYAGQCRCSRQDILRWEIRVLLNR